MGAGCIYIGYTGKGIHKKEIMKNKTLLYLLLGYGAFYLLAAKRKPKGRVIVPEPEKITEEQFRKPSLITKAAPVVKKIAEAIKKADQNKQKAVEAFLKKFGQKKIGQFPDIY